MISNQSTDFGRAFKDLVVMLRPQAEPETQIRAISETVYPYEFLR